MELPHEKEEAYLAVEYIGVNLALYLSTLLGRYQKDCVSDFVLWQAIRDILAPVISRKSELQRVQANDERPVEVRVVVRRALFKMDHHPMEVEPAEPTITELE